MGGLPEAVRSRTDEGPTGVQEGLEDRFKEAVEHVVEAVKPRLRGVLHEAAFAVSLITGTALVILATGPRATVAATVYAVSVAMLFGTSAAYHRGSWSPRAREVMERLDHSMIFVLIAGTYTPFALLLLEGWRQWAVFGGVWAGAVAGIVLRNVAPLRGRWLYTLLYVGLGWVAVFVLPDILREGGVVVLVLLIAGGLFYSAGAVVYARRRPDPSPRWFGFHEVFHALTLMAFIAHYIAVSFATYRYPGNT